MHIIINGSEGPLIPRPIHDFTKRSQFTKKIDKNEFITVRKGRTLVGGESGDVVLRYIVGLSIFMIKAADRVLFQRRNRTNIKEKWS
jgi:hypothetical protein